MQVKELHIEVFTGRWITTFRNTYEWLIPCLKPPATTQNIIISATKNKKQMWGERKKKKKKKRVGDCRGFRSIRSSCSVVDWFTDESQISPWPLVDWSQISPQQLTSDHRWLTAWHVVDRSQIDHQPMRMDRDLVTVFFSAWRILVQYLQPPCEAKW